MLLHRHQGKLRLVFWVMLFCGPRLLLCGLYYVLYDTVSKYLKYRIVGNFQGMKLSRNSVKFDFRFFFFNLQKSRKQIWKANSYMYKPETFHNHIFTKLSLLAKFAKVLSLENFRLYGTLYQYMCVNAHKALTLFK